MKISPSNLVRDFFVFSEEHDQLVHTNLKVTSSEFVRNVETQRTELSSLNTNCMEEGQR